MKKKIVITKREASRLEAEAGARAYEEHRSSSGDPTAIKALMEVGSSIDVAGLKVRPVTVAIFLALEELWKSPLYTEAVGSMKEVLTLYTYCEPVRAGALLARTPDQLADRCRAWAGSLQVEDARLISTLAAGHIADFYGRPPHEAKKKPSLKRSKTGARASATPAPAAAG